MAAGLPPRALGIQAGQPLRISNSDPVMCTPTTSLTGLAKPMVFGSTQLLRHRASAVPKFWVVCPL